jgi:hypothetical protein
MRYYKLYLIHLLKNLIVYCGCFLIKFSIGPEYEFLVSFFTNASLFHNIWLGDIYILFYVVIYFHTITSKHVARE